MTFSLNAVSRVKVGDANVFYRHNGPSDGPTLLLLHGYPSSSHQFRNVMPLLAERGYRVIAPDLPGFGFTTVPESYTYNFENLSLTLEGFVKALDLKRFAIYVFDYGAPTGLRLALRNPDKVAAIISQNGNAYEDGLGAEFWADVRQYWETGSQELRTKLHSVLDLPATRWQYENGSTAADSIQPEAYYLDQALMDRPGGREIQLDLLYDYRNNVALYPKFHEYFRNSGVPVLAMWGKNDTIFVPEGARAFERDVKKVEVNFLDSGHFALEGNEVEAVEVMDKFLHRFDVFAKA